MEYEPVYERFEAVGPDGQRQAVGFKKVGFLALGDQPEPYFFSLGGEEAVVAFSGEALRRFQQGRRYLSREEKIDVAGVAAETANRGRPPARLGKPVDPGRGTCRSSQRARSVTVRMR